MTILPCISKNILVISTCPVFLMRVARSLRRDCSWDPPPSSISNLALSNSRKSSSNDACSLLALRLERSRLNSYNFISRVRSWWWISWCLDEKTEEGSVPEWDHDEFHDDESMYEKRFLIHLMTPTLAFGKLLVVGV